MDKKIFKNKLITITTMLIIVCILFVSSYLLFLQESKVYLTDNITLKYDGESGYAKVEVLLEKKNYNQRKQDFMNSIRFEVNPNFNLKNGDVITIEANYDESLASLYHLKPIQEKRTLLVEGLPTRISSIKEIPYNFLLTINEYAQMFFSKHNDEIIHDYFIMFDNEKEVMISKNRLIHRVFLKSLVNEFHDRIVDVYCVSAIGNMSDDEGNILQSQENAIYYLVIYDEINDAFVMEEANVLGEKLITSQEQFSDEEIYALLNEKYQNEFELSKIY